MNKRLIHAKIRNIIPKDYNDVEHLLKASTNYHIMLDNDFKKMVEDNYEYFNNELQETLKLTNDNGMFVCEISDGTASKIVGILSYRFEEDAVYISDLYIQSPYRTNGYATRLLDELINRYPKKKIRLMCLVKNKLAYNFYTKYGFKIIETSKGKKYNISNYTMIFK